MESKRCGQNKVGICREGSQGQTYRAVVLEEEEENHGEAFAAFNTTAY